MQSTGDRWQDFGRVVRTVWDSSYEYTQQYSIPSEFYQCGWGDHMDCGGHHLHNRLRTFLRQEGHNDMVNRFIRPERVLRMMARRRREANAAANGSDSDPSTDEGESDDYGDGDGVLDDAEDGEPPRQKRIFFFGLTRFVSNIRSPGGTDFASPYSTTTGRIETAASSAAGVVVTGTEFSKSGFRSDEVERDEWSLQGWESSYDPDNDGGGGPWWTGGKWRRREDKAQKEGELESVQQAATAAATATATTRGGGYEPPAASMDEIPPGTSKA